MLLNDRRWFWTKWMWMVLGPYAWVQGRRATYKVTATSRGRLTNRYAWVPGRPTRRTCLGVNLPLQVPPCKHYPEEVTELKMAALILLRYRQRRLLRRNRIFRDRTNPLHKFNIWNCLGSLDSDEWIFSKWQTNWKKSSNIWIGRACYLQFSQAGEQRWILANNEHQ